MLASLRMLLKSLSSRDDMMRSQFVSTSILAPMIIAIITYHLLMRFLSFFPVQVNKSLTPEILFSINTVVN